MTTSIAAAVMVQVDGQTKDALEDLSAFSIMNKKSKYVEVMYLNINNVHNGQAKVTALLAYDGGTPVYPIFRVHAAHLRTHRLTEVC